MKSIMDKNPNDSFSFSRRYFNWKKKSEEQDCDDNNDDENLSYTSSSKRYEDQNVNVPTHSLQAKPPSKKKLPILTIAKLLSSFTFGKNRPHFSILGTKAVTTLFGYRRGHVHLAFQQDPKSSPAFLVELATPTNVLVREMASGLVRIALECEKKVDKKCPKLVDEPLWKTYCNGKKCGYAFRRECGVEEWKVLNSIGPITMGAGVLEGEVMYMRAKFERVVGSKDSEAFYMMSPDSHKGPELSIYLLRV